MTIGNHYITCPAPQFVTLWTEHYADGTEQAYTVKWDA